MLMKWSAKEISEQRNCKSNGVSLFAYCVLLAPALMRHFSGDDVRSIDEDEGRSKALR